MILMVFCGIDGILETFEREKHDEISLTMLIVLYKEVNVSDILHSLPTEAEQRLIILRVVYLDNLKFVFVLKDKLLEFLLVIELPQLRGNADHYVSWILGECQSNKRHIGLLVDIVACLKSLAMIHGKCHQCEVCRNLTVVVVLCIIHSYCVFRIG